MTKEYLPEFLLVVDALPRSSGGKLAKGQVRDLALAALAAGELDASAGPAVRPRPSSFPVGQP
ncbi:hypothetical protein HCA61_14940 [Rhodococcus sp. HNM0563]|uniref:hypothetical protein n=1 Tax=Rhodococcus sp. HNM0563 TaxID=2716339 RepID=UPI00146E8CA1|nr:hypothetical protein [Rhodococcus sp. HNM0563]NLU63552.1 hypothetical protein [Rhodococcus sp. HNM0563]